MKKSKNVFLNDFTPDTVVLIPHKKRQEIGVHIKGDDYVIQIDTIRKTGRNEDPFIWNKNFLYSFCKANTVNTNYLRAKYPYLVFIAIAEEGYVIDTVLKAKEYRKWPDRGTRTCSEVKKVLGLAEVNIVDEHFEEFDDNGNLLHHNNKVLYTCVGDEDMSFIPTINFEPLYIVEREVCNKLDEVFKTEKNKGYYVAHKNVPRLKGKEQLFESLVEDLKGYLEGSHQILTAKDLCNKVGCYKIKDEEFNLLCEYRQKINIKNRSKQC